MNTACYWSLELSRHIMSEDKKGPNRSMIEKKRCQLHIRIANNFEVYKYVYRKIKVGSYSIPYYM